MAKEFTENYSRRAFLKGSGAAAAATALTANASEVAAQQPRLQKSYAGRHAIKLNVNGQGP